MARYVAETACIASIYPGQLEDIRRSYGDSRDSVGPKSRRSTLFHIPPVPRGARPPYYVLELPDCFEDVLDIMAQGGHQGGPRPRIPKPVPVEAIVSDLLGRWTGGLFNVPVGAMPGVIQIIGTVPTQKELKQMETQQAAYFEYWFSQGEGLFRGDPTTVNNYKTYTTEMRLAAEWLGRPRPWSDPRIAADSENCPWCTTVISNQAIFCPNCRKQVREIPAHLAALTEASEKPVVGQKAG